MEKYTLVKNGTDEQVTVEANDLFEARQKASLLMAWPVWQLAWKRDAAPWRRPACEMSQEEAAQLNSPYIRPAIDAF